MDILKFSNEVAYFPVRSAQRTGHFFLDLIAVDAFTKKLKAEEPATRARTALKSAKRALLRESPDVGLGEIEVMRSARALKTLDIDNATSIGPQVVRLAIDELPNSKTGAEVAEQVTSEALKVMVDTFNQQVTFLPRQRQNPEE